MQSACCNGGQHFEILIVGRVLLFELDLVTKQQSPPATFRSLNDLYQISNCGREKIQNCKNVIDPHNEWASELQNIWHSSGPELFNIDIGIEMFNRM